MLFEIRIWIISSDGRAKHLFSRQHRSHGFACFNGNSICDAEKQKHIPWLVRHTLLSNLKLKMFTDRFPRTQLNLQHYHVPTAEQTVIHLDKINRRVGLGTENWSGRVYLCLSFACLFSQLGINIFHWRVCRRKRVLAAYVSGCRRYFRVSSTAKVSQCIR